MNRFYLTLSLLFCIQCAWAEDPPCSTIFHDEIFQEGLASSGLMANVARTEGSIAHQLRTMLKAATDRLLKKERPSSLACPANCVPSETPTIVLSTVPNRTLERYSDHATCSSILEQTVKDPISFANRKFGDVDALNEYLVQLCQGNGVDGELLYKKCHSSCSPRYSSEIEASPVGYTMITKVICGHARDKSDGQYQLSTKFRWSCQEKPSGDEENSRNLPGS